MSKKDIGYLIKVINDKLKVKADAELKHWQLTFVQSHVLAFLNEKGGSATQKELELFLEVSHPTVVGIVARMEQNGYVTTCFDCKDKRNKIVQCTPKATAIGAELERHILENERALLSALSPEDVYRLEALLYAVYKGLD